MKHYFILIILFFTSLLQAQTGAISGSLSDKEAGGTPLPFANVIIKGTTKGSTSDFDGNFIIENVAPGTYVIEVSFVGYKTAEVSDVIVIAGETTTVNTELSSEMLLDDVVITARTAQRESETALLLDQKKAVTQVAAIGAEQMAKQAVSDAAAASTKLAGVSKTEGSGDVFVRGLGDRYLYTTLNGLPIPSDDIEKKNIDLGLFSTRLIENISISKTYGAEQSSDQASGNVDISSKELSGREVFEVSASTSVNTNVTGSTLGDFKISPEFTDDVSGGIYINSGSALGNLDANTQTYNPGRDKWPVNRSLSVTYGKKIGDRLKVLATVGQGADHQYKNELFRQFRSNFIDDSIPDAIRWNKTVTTSGLLTANYKLNNESSDAIKLTALAVSKVADEVFEGGRSGTATIFEETDDGEAFQFIRDQNLKKTFLSVTQISGKNSLSEKNKLNWAVGYNFVSADEPNRVRNEVNFNFQDPNLAPNLVQLGQQGGFQQRKSLQEITDNEFNGRIADEISLLEVDEKSIELTVGANYRNKERDFRSQFFGYQESVLGTVNPASIDAIGDVLTFENVSNGLLRLNVQQEDLYIGTLKSYAGFVNFIGRFDNLTVGAGVRYQDDGINILYDVGNAPGGRFGEVDQNYNRLYPALNLKYEFNDQQSVRLSGSFTNTLPEFKEIAPFVYVSPVGQQVRGNTELVGSKNVNIDAKWEFFPTKDQLLSVTGFYKDIKDPISRGQERGGAGIFSYFNAGEKAEVLGIEAEARITIFGSEDDNGNKTPSLDLNVNASRMWHQQDLKNAVDPVTGEGQNFQYGSITETDLQGASDWIVNAGLSYSNEEEFPIEANLSLNYASDRIFALGTPESQAQAAIFYNDAIVENGFVTLDLIASKQITERWKIGVTGKNLLDPEIKRTQLVRPSTSITAQHPNGIETNETVLSYTRGVQLGFNLKYSF